MVKPLPVAHLHDFTLEIFHSGVGAAVLAALPCVGWSVHVGQKRDFINPQGVDDDMHMDIAAVVVSVRVVQTMAWCPGNCFRQNSSPNACARSTVKPLSTASRGSKLIM